MKFFFGSESFEILINARSQNSWVFWSLSMLRIFAELDNLKTISNHNKAMIHCVFSRRLYCEELNNYKQLLSTSLSTMWATLICRVAKTLFCLISGFSTKKCLNWIFGEFCQDDRYKSKHMAYFSFYSFSFGVQLCFPITVLYPFDVKIQIFPGYLHFANIVLL